MRRRVCRLRGNLATHVTASVYINDAEGGLIEDYDEWLEQLAPHEPVSKYRHNPHGEDNADAHGSERAIPRALGRVTMRAWTRAATCSHTPRSARRCTATTGRR